jgi:peptide/nickel transport system substrate-binding protein
MAQAEVVADELKVINFGGFNNLDPTHAPQFSSQYLRLAGAAEGLMRFTTAGALEPELALGLEPLDPSSWRIDLRPGVTFWSGRSVDAAAVAESLERARALSPPAAAQLEGLRLEPAGEWSLLVRADRAVPALPQILADQYLVVHNAAAYGPQENHDPAAVDLTGAFRPVEFVPGERLVLERHPAYWGPPPRTPRLRIQNVVDAEARSLAALSGEAHIVRNITPQAARQVERSPTMRLVPMANASAVSAFFNVRRPPFDDVGVRQALGWATDREAYVALALDGRGVPAPSWMAVNPVYPEARRVGYTRHDPARAGQLLDAAGWRLPPGGAVRQKGGAPLRFRLFWFGTSTGAEVLQRQWAAVGAEVTLEGSSDYGWLVARRAAGDWDAYLEGAFSLWEPAGLFRLYFAPDGGRNYAGLRDPELERLLARFDGLADAEARRQLVLELNARAAEVASFVPICDSQRLVAASRAVRNFEAHPWSSEYLMHPDLWAAA